MSASANCGSVVRSTTESSTLACVTVRDFEPYQRCCMTYSMRAGSSNSLRSLPQLEPKESARREGQEIRELADGREARAPEHLLGDQVVEGGEIELDRLRRACDVVYAEDDVFLPAPDVREDPRVLGAKRLIRSEAENRMLLPQRDEAVDPAQERRRGPQLRLDVDRLVAVHGIHQRLQVELGPVGAREAGVAVARPLHRSAHPVAVAEVDVVAHADLIPVVEDRRTRQREED